MISSIPSRTFLYLCEDHQDNPWKALLLKLVTALRRVTTRMSLKVLSLAWYLLSPFAIEAFSLAAGLLGRFTATRSLAEKMPFNFGTSWFSAHGDLMDRFGAPIEVRYHREEPRGVAQEGTAGRSGDHEVAILGRVGRQGREGDGMKRNRDLSRAGARRSTSVAGLAR